MPEYAAVALGLCAGLGLSAASGLRVFLPALLASLAIQLGWLPASDSMGWLGTTSATTGLGAATLLEIVAYYVPWLDNALDTVATPAAVVAGVLVSAASFVGLDPFVQWSCAIIVGGGAAASVQLGTVATRALSTGTTAGLANPAVSTAENVGAVGLTILAVVAPVVAAVCVVLVLALAFRRIARWRSQRMSARGES